MMTDITNLNDDVKMEWIDEGRILLVDTRVEATNRMSMYDQMIVDYMDSSAHIVDLIICLPQPKKAPPALKRLTSYQYQQHPRLGYVIMVGLNLNPIIRFLITSATRLTRMKMKTFPTVDEAVVFLRSVRPV